MFYNSILVLLTAVGLYMVFTLFILFIKAFTAQVLKVCRTPGPTAW